MSNQTYPNNDLPFDPSEIDGTPAHNENDAESSVMSVADQATTAELSGADAQEAELIASGHGTNQFITVNAGQVVVASKKLGKAQGFDGIESVLAKALTDAGRPVNFQFIDLAQASQVYTPENDQMEKNMRALEERYDEDDKAATLVIFAKRGVERTMFSYERFAKTLELRLAQSRGPAQQRLARFKAQFEAAIERYNTGDVVTGEDYEVNLEKPVAATIAEAGDYGF